MVVSAILAFRPGLFSLRHLMHGGDQRDQVIDRRLRQHAMAEVEDVARAAGRLGYDWFLVTRAPGAGAPRSNPSVLKSSSMSGQWMP